MPNEQTTKSIMMKPKVLLVNTNTEQMPYPVPPLGLSILANIIKDMYEVFLYDGVSLGHTRLSETIAQFKPDIIGFGIRNVDNMDMTNPCFYLDEVKKNFFDQARAVTQVPFIIGGSGYSLYPQSLLHFFDADYGLTGECEESFCLFLKAFFSTANFNEIPGLVTKTYVNTSIPLREIDNQSDIDLHIDFNYYKQRGAYSIQTKRGCYHHCIYCTYPLLEGRNYRKRTVISLLNEIENVCARIENPLIEFVDSTFNDPPGHAEEICEAIIKRGVKARFRTMGINPAHTSVNLFELMRAAGFTQIDCTPDSASPVMIRNFKKNFTIKQLEDTASFIKELAIPTMWFFIIGGPGETEKTLEETLSFIQDKIDPLNMIHLTTGLRIYPKTELHKIAIEQQFISKQDDLLLPKFYLSPDINKEYLELRLAAFARKNLNFIPAKESKPSAEMMVEAMKRRKEQKLTEPMFKTLLSIRYDWVKEGKIVL
ncbi:MAG: radical SAM protein [Bacteroidales bacterium]|nr:radical SAM protein [Bacteroidales bacterium]